jgi:hypothetical protein
MVPAALLMSASYTSTTTPSWGAELLGERPQQTHNTDEHHLVAQTQPVPGGQEDGIHEISDCRFHNAKELETPSEKSEDAYAGFH